MPKWVSVLLGIVLIIILLPFFLGIVLGGPALFPLISGNEWVGIIIFGVISMYAVFEFNRKYGSIWMWLGWDTPIEKQCPYCAETIKYEAIVCKFCGYTLNAEIPDMQKACPHCAEIINYESTVCRFCGTTLY